MKDVGEARRQIGNIIQ